MSESVQIDQEDESGLCIECGKEIDSARELIGCVFCIECASVGLDEEER